VIRPPPPPPRPRTGDVVRARSSFVPPTTRFRGDSADIVRVPTELEREAPRLPPTTGGGGGREGRHHRHRRRDDSPRRKKHAVGGRRSR